MKLFCQHLSSKNLLPPPSKTWFAITAEQTMRDIAPAKIESRRA
jgi:hypothetical protein